MNPSASVYDSTAPGVPGTTGTPTLIAKVETGQYGRTVMCYSEPHIPSVLAFVLSPSASITSGDGPMKARPACSTFRANSAFSERKP